MMETVDLVAIDTKLRDFNRLHIQLQLASIIYRPEVYQIKLNHQKNLAHHKEIEKQPTYCILLTVL